MTPNDSPSSPAREEREPDQDGWFCGRLLVGQGTDMWDPVCVLEPGHSGRCKPDADAVANAPSLQSLSPSSPERVTEEEPRSEDDFQERVEAWIVACFGPEIASDREERNHRFLEEALELVQACGCTASEAHQLVDYVFSRPVGEKGQESGGVSVTHAALCLANGLGMRMEAERELARVWTKMEKIRAKQAAKPKHSPLPKAERVTEPRVEEARVLRADREALLDAVKKAADALDMAKQGPGVSNYLRNVYETFGGGGRASGW